VFSDHHETGCSAIETMNDTRPFLPADAAEIVHVMEQRVDEGAAGVSGRRMHHHTGWFVDHDHVAVLVHNRQRQRFGLEAGLDRLRNVERNVLADLDQLVRLAGPPCDSHPTVLDEALDL